VDFAIGHKGSRIFYPSMTLSHELIDC